MLRTDRIMLSPGPLLALAVGALVLALGGCGSSADSTATSSKAAAENAQNTAQTKLNQCLADNGVTLDDPDDRESQQAQAALAGACAKFQKSAYGNLSQDQQAEVQDARLKFSACMDEQGIDMSNPETVDPEDPRVEAAMSQCDSLLPTSSGQTP